MKCMERKRNIYLDYLRGISALLIMLYHYTERYNQIFLHKESYPVVFTHGCDAVLMFFLLSGYLGIRGIQNQKPFEYAGKRFLKLYPTFAVSVIITFSLTTLFLPEKAVSFKDMLLNFTMIPGVFNAEYVDGVYWTLFCELAFYFIVFAVCLLRLQKHIDKLLILIVAAETTVALLPDNGVFVHIKNIDTTLYLHCFVAGGIIAVLENYYKKYKTVRLKKSENCKIILLIVSLGITVLIQFKYHEPFSVFSFAVSILLIAFLIVLYEKGITPNKTAGKILFPLEFISVISYPLYLFHQNAGYAIIYNLEKSGLTNEIFIIIPATVSIIVAYILNRCIEIPSGNLLKKVSKNR